METYYYSICTESHSSWDAEIQYKVNCNNWNEFINFCYAISYHFKSTVRACESKGYNNQGSYITNNIFDDNINLIHITG